MRWYNKVFLFVLACGCCLPAWANVTAASLFHDNMVLQQNQSVPVWGTATPGEKITVVFGPQTATATASAEGKWQVTLAAMPASGTPAELDISGQNTLRFTNVLVGEVWICSGQSNMQYAVRNANDAQQEIAAANYPQIRLFIVTPNPAPRPLDYCGGAWTVCSPQTVGGFSAVGYYFARELYSTLHMPIGVIETALGGMPAETWTSLEELKELPLFQARAAAFEKTLQGNPGARAGELSTLYNGMVAPLIPFGIRGVIWYQAESNATAPVEYRQLFPGLITSWRKAWHQGDFPFAFVQLPNYESVQKLPVETGSWAEIRDVQLQTLTLPQTAMAVTIDVGEADTIHPKNKQTVGMRLAMTVLSTVYGKTVESSGPRFRWLQLEGNQAILTFDHAEGLQAANSANVRAGILCGFPIAGADKIFHSANAHIVGNTVVVSSGNVPQPRAVRYAWANNPVCNLYNAAGLPASPFRTDTWNPKEVTSVNDALTFNTTPTAPRSINTLITLTAASSDDQPIRIPVPRRLQRRRRLALGRPDGRLFDDPAHHLATDRCA